MVAFAWGWERIYRGYACCPSTARAAELDVNARVLVVDDDMAHARATSRVLSADGYSVRTAASAGEALEMLSTYGADIVVTDVGMPVMDGLQLLGKIKCRWRDRPVVMMSGMGTVNLAVAAAQGGAADFIEKPIDFDKLRGVVRLALSSRGKEPRAAVVKIDVDKDLVGESVPLVGLKRLIKQIAPTDCRVLIQGENGTGKELIANALHRASRRKSAPFIKVNCGALPSTLLESELFGHEKGAFTGASTRRRGRFEMAHLGTLLLDEVGELSLEAQVRLLRVIQEGEFERVGGSQTLQVDVRLIAATNRDLYEMVCAGTFREDLYYRLNVVALHAPPLRNRISDIPLLVKHMIERMSPERQVRVSEEAMKALMERPYPGNVRELQNLVERFAVFFPGEEITPQHVSDLSGTGMPKREDEPETKRPFPVCLPGVSYRERLLQLEMRLITEALEQHGNKSAAAQSLGTDKSFFYRKCRQFGID